MTDETEIFRGGGPKTEEEIDRLFEKLSQGGAVAMLLAAYPFSKKFAWVADKYGVSWQLNLERN